MPPLPDQVATPTLLARAARLLTRQNTDDNIIIPSRYGALNSSLAPGAVAGIVLGSVFGFLLLLWLLYSCCANIGPPVSYRSDYGASRVTVDYRSSRSRGPPRHHKRRHSSRGARVYATETTRVRETTTGGPIIVDAEAVPMQERTRSVSRAPPPPRVVHDDDEDDEVVVIEESSPPRRSRRHSSRYDDRRRSRDY